jgi:hypothetical protein
MMEDKGWTDLAQDRDMWQEIANMVNLWVSQNLQNLSTSQQTIIFSIRNLLHAFV